jgi:peptidyl-dipeptidase Dcp
MRNRSLLALLVLVLFPAAARAAAAPEPAVSSNPFFAEWKTPFGVPPFDQVQMAHYRPAFTEAIARKRAEVKAISLKRSAPTFENTLVALDETGEMLDRVQAVFGALNGADTNDSLQAIAKEVAPLQAALRDDILLDAALFQRIKSVYERRDKLQLEPEPMRLLEETYSDFVRGGANLDAVQKTRLREINQELSVLGVTFGQNLLKATNAYRLVIDDPKDLAGLSERVVAGAAEAAKKAGLEGKWVFGLQGPSIWPFLEAADNRELRRQILTAYTSRCDHGDEQDNKAVILRIVQLRTERAELLGYKTYADFVLDKQMAKNGESVYRFLDQVWKPAVAVADREKAALQAQIDAAGGGFKLEPWDWRYYTEKERQARYDLDEDALRPYFKLENVRDGAFYVANRLYGLTFTPRPDLPVYNPEVKAFEVKEADGKHVGIFYTDYFPRPGKRGGAWSDELRQQCVRAGQDVRPVVINVCNFSRPAGDAPALLSMDETETLFHEFGHALHALLSDIHYKGLGNTPRDFVEMPSQIMENWVLEPEVLKVYARHWQTGAVIPADLVEKLLRARKFNQGFATVEYMAASYLDMDWHTWTEPKTVDVNAFEKASLDRIGLMPEIVTRYRTPYFNHIVGGYAAGYYSYLWADVLSADAFAAFQEKGIFDPATAQSFRKNLLAPGGTADAMALWLRFRGREPNPAALLEKRGLN